MHPRHSVDEEAEDVELAALERDDGPLRRQELGLRAVQRQLHTGVLQGRHSIVNSLGFSLHSHLNFGPIRGSSLQADTLEQ